MRADEVEVGERINHPFAGPDDKWIVEVTRRVDLLNRTRVYFKAKGQHGRFVVAPHKELEEM